MIRSSLDSAEVIESLEEGLDAVASVDREVIRSEEMPPAFKAYFGG